MFIEIVTKVEVEDQFLRDVFSTAVESGYPWWKQVKIVMGDYLAVLDGKQDWNVILIHEDMHDQDVASFTVVSLEDLASSISDCIRDGILDINVFEDFDASDADCILQMCVYGKVVFG